MIFFTDSRPIRTEGSICGRREFPAGGVFPVAARVSPQQSHTHLAASRRARETQENGQKQKILDNCYLFCIVVVGVFLRYHCYVFVELTK